MKNRFVRASILGLLCFAAPGASQDELAPPVSYPAIPKQASEPGGFVPAGWRLERESRGDLNGDGAPDLLLVLQMNDKRNVLRDRGLARTELDTNPQMLVLAFADRATKTYSLAAADSALIPRHSHPNMEPPFEKAEIVKGTLQVSLSLFMTAGGWYSSSNRFTFRYQNDCFKLIGYDSRVLKRNTGKVESVSINYLTQKAKITKGDLEEEENEVSWKPLSKSGLLCLDAVGDGLAFAPEHRPFP